MEQMEYGTTWFDGVTWVDVTGDSSQRPRNTDRNTGRSQERIVMDIAYELKLGILMVFPVEIICDILTRLPIEDLIRYQVVCKSWCRLTKDPQFISLQLSKSASRPTSYLLLGQSLTTLDHIFLMDIGNNIWKTSKEITLKCCGGDYNNMNIGSTCNGLLCVRVRGHEEPTIYNPVTNQEMRLPKSGTEYNKMFHFQYGFGFDWVTKKYKVVRVCYVCHDRIIPKFHSTAEIITVGERMWRPLELPHRVPHQRPVFLDGAFHWRVFNEDLSSEVDPILVMTIVDEKFQTIRFPPQVELSGVSVDIELINFGETLAVISHRRMDESVFQVWQVVGNRTNGGRIALHRFDTSHLVEQFGTGSLFKGRLSNGDFLCTRIAITRPLSPFNALSYFFFRFCPENNIGFPLDIPGVPRRFMCIPFKPSLASPGTFP